MQGKKIGDGKLRAEAAAEIDVPLNCTVSVRVPASASVAAPQSAGGGGTRGGSRRTARAREQRINVRIGDVITSEYGVGVLADSAVHTGVPSKKIKAALETLIASRHLDFRHPEAWRTEAETTLLPVIIQRWTDRARKFEQIGCSRQPGSHQP